MVDVNLEAVVTAAWDAWQEHPCKETGEALERAIEARFEAQLAAKTPLLTLAPELEKKIRDEALDGVSVMLLAELQAQRARTAELVKQIVADIDHTLSGIDLVKSGDMYDLGATTELKHLRDTIQSRWGAGG